VNQIRSNFVKIDLIGSVAKITTNRNVFVMSHIYYRVSWL